MADEFDEIEDFEDDLDLTRMQLNYSEKLPPN